MNRPASLHAVRGLCNGDEGLLAIPESITVKTVAGGKFERITGWRLKLHPVIHEPGGDSNEMEDYHSNNPEDIRIQDRTVWRFEKNVLGDGMFLDKHF